MAGYNLRISVPGLSAQGRKWYAEQSISSQRPLPKKRHGPPRIAYTQSCTHKTRDRRSFTILLDLFATMAEPVEPIQKRRLLRMTVAHYRQPNVSEEDFHHWVTEKHATQAAKLHAKNGIEGFSIVSLLFITKWDPLSYCHTMAQVS